ncbi:glycosyltransferase family protein [Myroides odoratimimus]|uniref:hypothetical protein n=1 Tax=Myroides odoratimimus TaxID=76832 RepID=UPI0029C06CCC|nr:hypothetical protein [Myroides odoratimimus]MDX4975377.1 hypothetical protein [Myroides odoratimimus]
MNILVVSYDFYPENLPNSFRWMNVIKEMQKEGHNFVVVSGRKGNYLEHEIIDGVEIYRFGEYSLDKYRYKSDTGPLDYDKEEKKKVSLKSMVKSGIKKFYDVLWRKVYWPDHACLWFQANKKKVLRLVDDHEISHVISVSWPFSSHRMALYLKEKCPNIFWLADTVDPFSLSILQNNYVLYARKNKNFEKRVFNKSDYNTVLTNHIKKTYIERFKFTKSNIAVVNNLFIPNNKLELSSIGNNHGVFVINYIGSLNREVRSPRLCLEFFRRFCYAYPSIKLAVNFYGNIADCNDDFLEYLDVLDRIVFIKGMINKQEVIEVINNSDVLINIGNSNEYQEPSKVIEYIYSNKKVLNFYTLENDTSKTLLKNYNKKLDVGANDSGNKEILKRFKEFLEKDIESNLQEDFFEPYMLTTIANKYLNILQDKNADKR